MPVRDLHNNINVRPGLAPLATALADNTAQVSTIADTLGFESIEYIILTGILADVDATFAVTMDESDASNMSGSNAVAAADLLGTYALASFTFAADGAAFKIGYVGNRRYVRVTITPANNTGAAPIAGAWIYGHAAVKPTANPPV